MGPFKSLLYTACLVSVLVWEVNGLEDFDYKESVPTPNIPKKCFQDYDKPLLRESSINRILKDELLKTCYVDMEARQGVEFNFFQLVTASTDSAGKEYDLFADLFCPTWPQSKQCLTDYLTNRCNSSEIAIIRDAEMFNVQIATPLLMCDPNWKNKLRYFFTTAKETGLLSCFIDKTEFARTQRKCTVGSESTYEKTGIYPTFRAYFQQFESCSTPLLHLCAEGDQAKTVKIKELFKDIMSTIVENYDLFWENYLLSRN